MNKIHIEFDTRTILVCVILGLSITGDMEIGRTLGEVITETSALIPKSAPSQVSLASSQSVRATPNGGVE